MRRQTVAHLTWGGGPESYLVTNVVIAVIILGWALWWVVRRRDGETAPREW